MEIFRNLTDDQLALLGCVVALVFSGTVMALSHFIGRARREDRLRDGQTQDTIRASIPEEREAAPERRRVA